MSVAVHHQVDNGRHGPQVDLDVGIDVLLVDLTTDEALTAEANIVMQSPLFLSPSGMTRRNNQTQP